MALSSFTDELTPGAEFSSSKAHAEEERLRELADRKEGVRSLTDSKHRAELSDSAESNGDLGTRTPELEVLSKCESTITQSSESLFSLEGLLEDSIRRWSRPNERARW